MDNKLKVTIKIAFPALDSADLQIIILFFFLFKNFVNVSMQESESTSYSAKVVVYFSLVMNGPIKENC